MKTRLILALLATSALCACAGTLTPQRCEQALTGLSTASDIAAILIHYGYAPDAAAKAAEAISAARLAVSAACDAANPPPVVSPGQ